LPIATTMPDKLRQKLEKRQAQELEVVAKRVLEDEDFDLSKASQQLVAYDYLLSKIPNSRIRKILGAIAVGLASATLAGLLWTVRTNNNKMVLDIQVSNVGMTLDQQYDWEPDESLPVRYMELSRLKEVAAPPSLRIAFQNPDGEGHLVVEKGRVLVSRLVFLPTKAVSAARDTSASRVEFRIEDKNVVRLILKATSLRTRFSFRGNVHMASRAGRTNDASVFDYSIDPAGPPESIETISASNRVIPVTALIGLEAPMRLYDTPVRDLSFYKHQGAAGAQNSFISSVHDGSLTFVEVGRTVAIPRRARITFDGSEGRMVQLVIDNGIQLSFEGQVDRVYLNNEDLTPRWLEFIYNSQPLALIWATVGFLWGISWSLKRLLT